ncbi:hypothetical protein [Cupriavidus metallidurans]|uniref:DUF1877 family protein n=1 Tax=Cupriavidus metallidurans (strain ATCC 43123 / DSM 2839 / NBRC 102507 / CH34) TaxID=266264 RepID=Q1LC02_CUPMC|nr:hypothetical protein [Cupriavidus metallidurans]ABF12324.1 conserved hypothetical protein [Cupriavidus metallidurans CH34]QGS32436.1 hypothetical protein FOB83_26760 [Cupriavidus metallidurans]
MSLGPFYAAVKNLTKLEGYDPDYPGTWPHRTIEIEVDAEYPEYPEGLEVGALYQYESEENYWLNADQDMYFFKWREKLVQMVGEKSVEEAEGQFPFCELIRHQGSTGGTIGPVVCEKIASDFDAWEAAARSLGDERFFEYYVHIRRAFEFARGTGAVSLCVLF